MTEASKQRMEESLKKYIECINVKETDKHDYAIFRFSDLKLSFEAGFCDAILYTHKELKWKNEWIAQLEGFLDAADKIASLNILEQKAITHLTKLEAENKRLKGAMDFAIGHLGSMDNYSVVSGTIHILKKALSSGGE